MANVTLSDENVRSSDIGGVSMCSSKCTLLKENFFLQARFLFVQVFNVNAAAVHRSNQQLNEDALLQEILTRLQVSIKPGERNLAVVKYNTLGYSIQSPKRSTIVRWMNERSLPKWKSCQCSLIQAGNSDTSFVSTIVPENRSGSGSSLEQSHSSVRGWASFEENRLNQQSGHGSTGRSHQYSSSSPLSSMDDSYKMPEYGQGWAEGSGMRGSRWQSTSNVQGSTEDLERNQQHGSLPRMTRYGEGWAADSSDASAERTQRGSVYHGQESTEQPGEQLRSYRNQQHDSLSRRSSKENLMETSGYQKILDYSAALESTEQHQSHEQLHNSKSNSERLAQKKSQGVDSSESSTSSELGIKGSWMCSCIDSDNIRLDAQVNLNISEGSRGLTEEMNAIRKDMPY